MGQQYDPPPCPSQTVEDGQHQSKYGRTAFQPQLVMLVSHVACARAFPPVNRDRSGVKSQRILVINEEAKRRVMLSVVNIFAAGFETVLEVSFLSSFLVSE